MDRKAAQKHLERVAKRHNITLRQIPALTAETAGCSLSKRTAYGPVLRTVADYVSMLHECGHLASPTAQTWEARHSTSRGRERHHDMFMIEAAAWAWAFRQASRTILAQATARDGQRMGAMLMSYGLR